MFTITAPDPKPGRSRFLDVDFHDGVATVDDLHPIRHQAFQQHGYAVFESVRLDQLSKPELRALVDETEGLEVPSKATKAQLIEALEAHDWPVVGTDEADA